MNRNNPILNLTNIQNIINDNWEQTGNNSKQLVEIQQSKIISQIKIITEGQYLLYKFEKGGQIQIPYFKDTKSVQKICDYVLFTIKSNQISYMFYFLN